MTIVQRAQIVVDDGSEISSRNVACIKAYRRQWIYNYSTNLVYNNLKDVLLDLVS